MVRPSWKRLKYSHTCPETNTAPMRKVSVYHSRIPHDVTFKRLPVRDARMCSAAWTPSWQVTELSTRISVFTAAYRMSSRPCPYFHSEVVPGAAAELVTLRTVKYAANRAAKNISSLASHTIVPTATMSGPVSYTHLTLPTKRIV